MKELGLNAAGRKEQASGSQPARPLSVRPCIRSHGRRNAPMVYLPADTPSAFSRSTWFTARDATY